MLLKIPSGFDGILGDGLGRLRTVGEASRVSEIDVIRLGVEFK
jgi:hypothetical protein